MPWVTGGIVTESKDENLLILHILNPYNKVLPTNISHQRRKTNFGLMSFDRGNLIKKPNIIEIGSVKF